MAAPLLGAEAVDVEKNIRYVPCPLCNKLMNRVNFAHCSHVVVDVCTLHGTWFDKDELRRIVEFIRSGGLEAARLRQISDLETKRRQLKSAQSAESWDSSSVIDNPNPIDWSVGIAAAADVLRLLFRK
jgi:hypothetical protein